MGRPKRTELQVAQDVLNEILAKLDSTKARTAELEIKRKEAFNNLQMLKLKNIETMLDKLGLNLDELSDILDRLEALASEKNIPINELLNTL